MSLHAWFYASMVLTRVDHLFIHNYIISLLNITLMTYFNCPDAVRTIKRTIQLYNSKLRNVELITIRGGKGVVADN